MVFAIVSCFPRSLKTAMPFAISLLVKCGNLHLKPFPLWREWQMEGVFFAQVLIWIESFGPAFIATALGFLTRRGPAAFHTHLTGMAAFTVLNVFRDWNDFLRNGLAIEVVFMSHIVLLFVKMLSGRPRDFERPIRGLIGAVSFAVYISYVVGGTLALLRATGAISTFLAPAEVQVAMSQIAALPSDAVVLCGAAVCRIVLYTGGQVVFAGLAVIWIEERPRQFQRPIRPR
jgi:hypothetical protein